MSLSPGPSTEPAPRPLVMLCLSSTLCLSLCLQKRSLPEGVRTWGVGDYRLGREGSEWSSSPLAEGAGHNSIVPRAGKQFMAPSWQNPKDQRPLEKSAIATVFQLCEREHGGHLPFTPLIKYLLALGCREDWEQMVKQAVTKYLDSFLTQHALLYSLYWEEGVWGLCTGSRCVFE